MPQNLVEGGARRGWFQTRNSRQVFLHTEYDFMQAPLPGKEPVARKCWKGTIYQGDAKTRDTEGVWEQSGAYQNVNGVIQQRDLVQFVERKEPDDAPAGPQPALVALPAEAESSIANTALFYGNILSEIGEILGESQAEKLPNLVRDLMDSYRDALKRLKKRNQKPEDAETKPESEAALSAA